MTALFVTASGTDIGKTYLTAGLIRALLQQGRSVGALKPVLSGFDPNAMASSDAGELLAALGHRIDMATIEQVSPWRFAAPLSPDMAARRENRSVPFDGLVSFCRSQIAAAPDTLLIEGVGGVMVPLDERHTVLDWLAALEIPALLVVGSYLGAISHTLTALSVLRARAIPVSMIIINETQGSTVALEEGAATVRRFTGATEVVTMRRNPDSGDFAAIASRL